MPLILTLKLDEASFTELDVLRKSHFPAKRNLVPAHVTLFHALPAAEERCIAADLEEECSKTPAMNLLFTPLRFMGNGVAVEVGCDALRDVRKRLLSKWQRWLGRQDRAPYRPHVTIQNKVSPDEARRTFDALVDAWHPLHGLGTGLQLWRYMGGPWDPLAEYLFHRQDRPSQD